MKEMIASPDQHVAVLTFPFASHPAPLLTLARRITAEYPNVTISFFGTERSNGAVFSGGSDDSNIKAYNVDDGIPEGHKLSPNPAEPIGFFLKSAVENFKKAMEIAVADTGKEISCLLADAFLWFAGEMAEEMQISWVPFWTSGPFPLSLHFHTDLIREKMGQNGTAAEHKDKTLDFIPGCSAITVGDLVDGIATGNIESPISIMLHKMAQMLPQATAVVMNSFEEIDPTITKDLKSKLNKVLNVGPLALFSPPAVTCSDEHGCLEWLDKQKPSSVAYISFGSVIKPPPHELVALAEALEESGVPFLWSFRGNPNDHLPEGFLERTTIESEKIGKIVPWAPQSKVLEHGSTGVFLTHCGWNSVLETITGGVPMICRPFFGDQKLNLKVVQDLWRIGVGVENGVITKSGTTKALELILSKDEGKEVRERIRVLKDLAVEAAGSNGSSVKNFQDLMQVITKCNNV